MALSSDPPDEKPSISSQTAAPSAKKLGKQAVASTSASAANKRKVESEPAQARKKSTLSSVTGPTASPSIAKKPMAKKVKSQHAHLSRPEASTSASRGSTPIGPTSGPTGTDVVLSSKMYDKLFGAKLDEPKPVRRSDPSTATPARRSDSSRVSTPIASTGTATTTTTSKSVDPLARIKISKKEGGSSTPKEKVLTSAERFSQLRPTPVPREKVQIWPSKEQWERGKYDKKVRTQMLLSNGRTKKYKLVARKASARPTVRSSQLRGRLMSATKPDEVVPMMPEVRNPNELFPLESFDITRVMGQQDSLRAPIQTLLWRNDPDALLKHIAQRKLLKAQYDAIAPRSKAPPTPASSSGGKTPHDPRPIDPSLPSYGAVRAQSQNRELTLDGFGSINKQHAGKGIHIKLMHPFVPFASWTEIRNAQTTGGKSDLFTPLSMSLPTPLNQTHGRTPYMSGIKEEPH
ncbi:uncharacterized protein L969DRAFT_87618 [Mixia osmundae IAM 14324]|uniref:Uncharacterized protein n=1 Tax=Mixia osmundae (strain CBS 9802 / IAM 14324 / JCM 22182 / KY 12970) TaxID=764103 RepID=G7DVR2_MIXOS|nr:uncharacterized protein L969DRAFT_87618 [Mixia osmundae IAM 14324]KEI39647.1 hypothetical protein L969DRAFT_87618 [Mixia osmundae IAM 14324]GAA94672.1 hypothetical protein E5Q_01325 [Mixia osmundae IAM 14324]